MAFLPRRLLTQLHDIRTTAKAIVDVARHQFINYPVPPSFVPFARVTPQRGFTALPIPKEQPNPVPLTDDNSDEVRAVMRNVPQPVVVVTTCSPTDPTNRRGITVSSFTSVSLHPQPLVSFCIRKPSRASTLLHASSLFVVHILSSLQVAQAMAFSSPTDSQFDNISFYVDPATKLPVLMGAVGAMHCRRERVIEVGDHELWIAGVYKVEHGVGGVMGVKEEAQPLLYHDRKYRSVGDQVFMRAFEDQTLNFGEWSHRAHVRMAWNYMRELGKEKAVPLIKHGIQKYNAANSQKIRTDFNETITSFYIEMIDKAIRADQDHRIEHQSPAQDGDDFFAFLQRFPSLADRKLIYRYYSKETMKSEKAKMEFVEPDLQSLPDYVEPVVQHAVGDGGREGIEMTGGARDSPEMGCHVIPPNSNHVELRTHLFLPLPPLLHFTSGIMSGDTPAPRHSQRIISVPSLPVSVLEFTGYTDITPVTTVSDAPTYRAFSTARQQPVFIKTCPTKLEDVAKLRHEWKILQGLPDNVRGVLKPLALETSSHGMGLVFPGDRLFRPLNHVFLTPATTTALIPRRQIDLNTFLDIALQAATILIDLHAAKVIHKNINSSNLVLAPNDDVYIQDFMIASCLEREETAMMAKTYNAKILEGTLAYLAPENTGRMNRSIDKRCDYYALGCTFYELLTKRLPFLATDPLELMYQHIAQPVVPPHEINPSIPRAISDMIVKLMAKTPEERYQGAEGLKADLEEMLSRCCGALPVFTTAEIVWEGGRGWEIDGGIREGEKYGKHGDGDFGKTSLVNEVQRPVVSSRGYFTNSKFDLFQRDIPFVSLIQAFRELIRQLLTESSQSLALWRKNIQDAVGADGRVIADVIPDVEKIIGPQPPIPQLGPSETEGRFTRVFQRFIRVFGQKDHPLVLFLGWYCGSPSRSQGSMPGCVKTENDPTAVQNQSRDLCFEFTHDLQWSSQTELQMIKKILYNPDSQCLLVIGAYRSNEVQSGHLLSLILNDIIADKKAKLHIIDLEPLKEVSVRQIVCATLHCDDTLSPETAVDIMDEDVRNEERSVVKLSRLIFDKTDGNPFFLLQVSLLKSLYQEQLLIFSFVTRSWEWDMNTLSLKEISPNVVDLLVGQLQKLSPRAQNIICLASCIGNRFTSDILSIVNDKDLVNTMSELWDALSQQFIVPLDSKYKMPLAYAEDPDDVLQRDVWNALVAATAGSTAPQNGLSPMVSEPQRTDSPFDQKTLARHILFFFDPETNTHRISQEPVIITFRFLHDRVQQAAYTLIPEERRQATHLRIGQLLLKFADEEAAKVREEGNAFEHCGGLDATSDMPSQQEGSFLEKNIFDIVNQLNAGLDLLISSHSAEDKNRLARLNLAAGRKAKDSTAFEAAMKYLRTGLRLLDDQCWEKQYDLTITLYIELADAEYAACLFKDARAHFQFALDKSKSLVDQGKIYNRLLKCYTGEGTPDQAVVCGLEGLRHLGHAIPEEAAEIDRYCAEESRQLVCIENSNIMELAQRPPMNDLIEREVIRILVNLIPPVYFARPELLPPIVVSAAAMSVRSGDSPEGSYAYCLYGLLLSGQAGDAKNRHRTVKDIETSYEWGKLAIQIANSLERSAIKCPVFKVYASHIQCWNEPLRNTFSTFEVAIQEGVSTHNGEYTGYGCTELCMYLFFSGESLETISQRYVAYFDIVTKFKQDIGNFYIKIGYQVVLNLLGKSSKNTITITGDVFDEDKDYSIIVERNYLLHIMCFFMYKLILFVMFRNKEEAIKYSKKAADMAHGGLGTLFVAEIWFWRSLALIENFDTLTDDERNEIQQRIEQIRNWSVLTPSCFQHKLDLLCAMHARIVQKDFLTALDLFDKSIAGAKEHGYVQEAALANELAAEFCLERKRDRLAADYLYDAYYCYIRWGAVAKLDHMMEIYAGVLKKMSFARALLESELMLIQARPTVTSSDDAESDNSLCKGDGENAPGSAQWSDFRTDPLPTQTAPVETGSPPRKPLVSRGYESKLNTVTELDLATVMSASLVISEEIVLENLLEKLMNILLKTAGAERAVLILEKDDHLFIEASASGSAQFPEILIHHSEPIENNAASLPIAIVNYVARTKESIINDLSLTLPLLTNDAYILTINPKSLLCIAIMHQGTLTGVLYMENRHVSKAFTQERIDILQLLSSQAAISIKKAQLYQDLNAVNERLKKSNEQIEEQNRTLEQKVNERTKQLQKAKEMAEFATQMKSTFLANMSHGGINIVYLSSLVIIFINHGRLNVHIAS
ncbi:hypothetical protein BC936DRAFT_143881 [Jimgerdemannia flammicorona]|uniref:Protein kinase domain-containing protein n=1 Tax=Jimgerdemannia flammicorona TaxID=994334 RepID=A0A433DDA2_9FUNG|nr:hypothetical protein BC936DRAFT_143881 [Jimgerdemannia flammicorona]